MLPEYKYKQIYNPKSNRLQNYDYSSNWWYFITICTKNRENYFGEIVDWKMILNNIWEIVYEEIKNIPILRQNVLLDEFIIMPNHLHMILIINNDLISEKKCRDVSLKHLNNTCKDIPKQDVPAEHLYGGNKYIDRDNWYYWNISPKKWTIWNIIKLFKSYTTKTINKTQDKIYFAWQSNYYDRIIRNEDEIQRIRKYILENPLKWELDKNNAENLLM